jgi:hypothetical protein
LMCSNRHKETESWERKIVLPEARKAFTARHRLIMELNGEIPNNLLESLSGVDEP